MDTIQQDIRYALRMLWKHRFATFICAAALALGMGANTAIFSMAEAFLLHPVPLEHVDRMVGLVDVQPAQSFNPMNVSPATYLEWQQQAQSFDKLSAYAWDGVNFTGDGTPQKIQDFQITTNFFSTLGVQPQLGRDFLAEEGEPGKNHELILSYGLWERRYASDPKILGRSVKVDGKPFNVVGVMPKGFDYPLSAEAWVPMALDAKQRAQRDSRFLWVVGHLKPQVSIEQAWAEMLTITKHQADAFPDAYKGWQLRVMNLGEFAAGELTRQYTLLLLGAVAFVLLIACADVANVQFARVSGRQKELAVRVAMGATRGRIVRQLLIESVLLSLLGAVLSIFLAQWSLGIILSHMPPDIARYIAGWKSISVDFGAFLFTFAVALVSGILSGIAPSLMSSRTNISETLKESGRGASSGRARHRLRSALVIAEVSMALVLLVGAGLLVKGFQALLSVNQNYHPESLLTFNLTLPELQYQEKSARVQFHDRLLPSLAGIPNVQSVALVTTVPYANGGGIGTQKFEIEGRPVEKREESRSAIVESISPNYFSLMSIGLRNGRTLADSDGADTPRVTVISDSLAQRYFPSEDPLGRKLQINPSEPPFTIVGIVDEVHYSWVQKEPVPTIYLPYRQNPNFFTTVVLRTGAAPLTFTSAVRQKIGLIDPDLPIYEVKGLDHVITESIIGIAYVAAMMAAIGFIALVLACVGVYGVMSYSVSERTHEMGIRMAMGATESSINRLVVGNGMLLTLIGIAIGLPLAFALARAMSSLLFGVTATDPFSFIGLPLILAAVAALASYLPARRAMRVDPLTALRYE
ncbi:MAG TPA: ABC transporter permease [Candidatus Acidoferrum sp.]